ncbi:hypothetical protein ACKH8N_004670, partial [Escherichia coli]
NQPVAERGKLRRLAAEVRRPRSNITSLRPATAGLFLSGHCHKVNNPLFTLHRIFTLYHHEIIYKKPEVNSVNSKT